MFNILNKLPKSFINKPIAHRGFHDCNGSFKKGFGPENSRESVLYAVQNGLGIEIDVRFTKDYVPIVIHDNYLKRLCGVDKYLSNINYNELKHLKLINHENLPTLNEILSIVNGSTPILIEFKKFKRNQDYNHIKKGLYFILKKYSGPLALMSFDLKLVVHFSKKLPNIIRGLVLEKYDHNKKIFSSKIESRITEYQMQKNGIGFVSIKYNQLTKEFYNLNKRKKRDVISWTINTNSDARRIKNLCDNITFEGFRPTLKKGKS